MTDFNSKQYKRVIAACEERSKYPTMAWMPDEEKCVHAKLHDAQDELINFEEDSEYQRMFNQHTDAMKQQSELIERWVEKEEKKIPFSVRMESFKAKCVKAGVLLEEEKRPPPRPPKSPYE